MAVQVNPITQSLPATTAIQDPATRRFAQAVEDTLRALRSEEGAVESLKKAAGAMNNAVAGGTPPSIAQWLFSSELYQKLTTEIARVDVKAKQDLLAESMARSQAIQEIQAALAEIESTPAYDPATPYQIGALVTYENKLYRAKAETTGNLPTNTTYWDKVGDYASLGDVVAAHTLQLSEIESDITDIGGDLAAEITARDTLATQLRGTYTGADVAMVSQGLLYSERQARVTADGVTASNLNALRAQVGVTEAGALTEGFILTEQTIRNTNDLAIVSAVNTALAQITGVSTSISQSGQNLIANWTTAQANKWSQIEAEVLTAGGQTIRAALLQESQTRASLEGDVYASYTLRVDANGNIAGFGLAADENSSEFIIRADKFALVTNVGGTPYVPFAIGPSGAEFTGLTSWGNVTGGGKPADGATSGANLVKKSHFRDGLAGGWGGTVSINGAANSGRGEIASSSRDAYEYGNEFAVVGNEKLFVAYDAFTAFTAHETRFGLQFLDAAGGTITWVGVPTAAGQNWHHVKGEITVPTGAVTARPWLQISATDNFGVSFWNALYVGRVEESATFGASFGDYWGVGKNITGAITPGNVTTYIDNAALGNAQIGGNLWSTNWNYAGGTGWLLDRSGNFYGNNIYARGDIEASSLKANTAMVQTLNIAGNAVIVPTYVEYPSTAAYNVYQNGTETEWTLLSDVVTVNVDCSALIFIGCNDSIASTVHTVSAGAGGRGHYNWPAGTEWASIRLYRNSSLVKRLAQWNVSSTVKGAGKHIGTYYAMEKDCVFIDTLVVEVPLVAGANTIDIRGWVKMADGDGGARRNSNAYMLIMGAQR